MPIFEYRCESCGHKFEAILFGEQKAECPSCHTGKLEAQLSTFSVSTKSNARGVSGLWKVQLLHDGRLLRQLNALL